MAPAPMTHSIRLWLETEFESRPGRISVIEVVHNAYTMLQTSQRPGVYSVVYGTVHYKEPFKPFDKSGA